MSRINRLFRPRRPVENDRHDLQRKAIRILSRKKYDFIEEIGTGGFGDVLALKLRHDHKMVAAKIIDPMVTSVGEVTLWPMFDHPNVLPVLEIMRRPTVDIFLMPHHPKCLIEILEDRTYRYSPESFKTNIQWMTDVVSGLEYLHNSGVCHLDLKVDNILISAQNSAVICDFSAVEVTGKPTDKYVLPRYYCPPEAWSLLSTRPKVDGRALDIWSMGMIIFYCFSDRWMESHLGGQINWWDGIYPLIFKCLQMPFFQTLTQRAFPCATISKEVCAQALNLLQGVLRYRADDRPTTRRIRQHILMSKVRFNKCLLEPDVIWIEDQRTAGIESDDGSFSAFKGLEGNFTTMLNTAVATIRNTRGGATGQKDCEETVVKFEMNGNLWSRIRAWFQNKWSAVKKWICCK